MIGRTVLLLPILFVVERRALEPVVPVHLFSLRTFSVSSATGFIIGVAMFGAISFLPLFLQVVNGASATSSGLLLLPLMLGLLAASVTSGRIISRTGRYKVFPVSGTVIAAVAMFLLSTMGTGTSQSPVTVSVAGPTVFCCGGGMFGALSFLALVLQVVDGASATGAGLLLLPLMLGLRAASVTSGRIISRTGRYKVFPVSGTVIAAVAMFLLSTMGTGTSQSTVTVYMVLLGIGLGLTMQTLVLATQNAVPTSDPGAATAAVRFFRSLGGSLALPLFGAPFHTPAQRRG